jgi:hypothetical protein
MVGIEGNIGIDRRWQRVRGVTRIDCEASVHSSVDDVSGIAGAAPCAQQRGAEDRDAKSLASHAVRMSKSEATRRRA